MLMKNKKTGEVEGLHYGPAMDALAAGTHKVVNEPAEHGKDAPKGKPEVKAETKLKA
jgi:hypothetical protein